MRHGTLVLDRRKPWLPGCRHDEAAEHEVRWVSTEEDGWRDAVAPPYVDLSTFEAYRARATEWPGLSFAVEWTIEAPTIGEVTWTMAFVDGVEWSSVGEAAELPPTVLRIQCTYVDLVGFLLARRPLSEFARPAAIATTAIGAMSCLTGLVFDRAALRRFDGREVELWDALADATQEKGRRS